MLPETIPENMDLTDEDISFEIPEHYSHISPEIATMFCSVENIPDYRYVPNMLLDEQMSSDMHGITSDLYSDFYGEVPMMSQQADILLFLKPMTWKL